MVPSFCLLGQANPTPRTPHEQADARRSRGVDKGHFENDNNFMDCQTQPAVPELVLINTNVKYTVLAYN